MLAEQLFCRTALAGCFRYVKSERVCRFPKIKEIEVKIKETVGFSTLIEPH